MPLAVEQFRHQVVAGTESVNAVGAAITLDRLPFTIVGVTPPSFYGAEIGRILDGP